MVSGARRLARGGVQTRPELLRAEGAGAQGSVSHLFGGDFDCGLWTLYSGSQPVFFSAFTVGVFLKIAGFFSQGRHWNGAQDGTELLR